MMVWPLEPVWSKRAYQGFGRPRQPRLRSGQRLTMASGSLALPKESWREITGGGGVPGTGSPAKSTWAIYRQNLDGSEPRYYLSNAQKAPRWRPWPTWEGRGWRIETEFETEKSDIGLDEYETRSWAGWHHHVALCLLGGAFLLGLQQDWGKRCFSAAARRFSWERFARSLRREQEGFTILMRIDQ